MASVWVARQRGKHGFEKLVAIKTILPKFASDVRFQEMFLDEARIASRIEHANVAQIFDLGEENEILYLAMEYVDGDALSKLNRACQRKGLRDSDGRAPARPLRHVRRPSRGARDAATRRGARSRSSIATSARTTSSSARRAPRSSSTSASPRLARAPGAETSSGVLKGKIQYMAPEQALGQRLDRRADIWAVGAILYTLLTGKPPFEGENPLATLHLLGSGRPPMPLPSSVHPAISTIVRRALSFAADHRYRDRGRPARRDRARDGGRAVRDDRLRGRRVRRRASLGPHREAPRLGRRSARRGGGARAAASGRRTDDRRASCPGFRPGARPGRRRAPACCRAPCRRAPRLEPRRPPRSHRRSRRWRGSLRACRSRRRTRRRTRRSVRRRSTPRSRPDKSRKGMFALVGALAAGRGWRRGRSRSTCSVPVQPAVTRPCCRRDHGDARQERGAERPRSEAPPAAPDSASSPSCSR